MGQLEGCKVFEETMKEERERLIRHRWKEKLKPGQPFVLSTGGKRMASVTAYRLVTQKGISLGQKEEPLPYLVGQEEAWMQVTGLRRGQAGPFTSSAFGRDRSLNSILLWCPCVEHSDCCLSQNFTSDFHAIFFHRKRKKG